MNTVLITFHYIFKFFLMAVRKISHFLCSKNKKEVILFLFEFYNFVLWNHQSHYRNFITVRR